jgi:hypothetical protein
MNAKSPFQELENSEEYRMVSIKMAGTAQFVELQIRGRRLQVLFSSGEIRKVNTISFYQPDLKLFWWRYGHYSTDIMAYIEKTSHFSKDLARIFNLFLPSPQCFIYLSENKIACFRLSNTVHNTVLLIRESSTRYPTIEQAYQRVRFVLENNRTEIERDNHYKWFSHLKLSEHLDREFFYLQNFSAMPMPAAKIAQVTEYDNGHWQIDLESSDNRKATLILQNRHGNQSEPLLLTDDYYNNRKTEAMSDDDGDIDIVSVPDDDYKVIEVLADDSIKAQKWR